MKLINCGSKQGGATKRAPANWTTSLATVFQSKYPGIITTYYPYSLTLTSNTTSLVPNPSGRSEIPTWVIGVILSVAVIGIFLVVWFFCRRRSKRLRMNTAKSELVHESGCRQVHELGEYEGYNYLALIVVLRVFLIIFAFIDPSRLVELPTNYNSNSIHQVALTRLHRMSDSPSLYKILVLNNVSSGTGIQNNKSPSSHGRSVSLPASLLLRQPGC